MYSYYGSALLITVCFHSSIELPDSVSISYRKYPDPMVEGHQYLLQCLVQNIAPIGRLRVTFYKVSATGEQTELATRQKAKDNIKTPENGTYTLDFTPGRDDDGAQLLCSAMLDLGPEGPQPPPVMDSNLLNITVHCESFWFSVYTHLVQQLVN